MDDTRCPHRTIFFMVGCQKSGTTWLQKLLAAHPEVACGGESHLADLLAAPFLQIAQQYNARQQRRDHPGHRVLLEQEDVLATLRFLGDRLMQRYLPGKGEAPHARPLARGQRGIRAIGDKTPEHALAIPLLRQVYSNCRVIHIIRDGRDAAVSGWAHLERQGGSEKFASFADYTAYFAEHHWKRYINAARSATRDDPSSVLEVRYEALHAEPLIETQRMLEFLAVDATDEVVRGCIEAASFRKLSGRNSGTEDRGSFFRKGAVGDWREQMDVETARRFESIAGDLLAELGYERALIAT